MTTIVVTAAVVERNNTFLVTRRQRGVHLEGYWEFPGGKREPNETFEQCLERELHEVGTVQSGRPSATPVSFGVCIPAGSM